MFFLFVSFFPFALLLSKSLPLKPLPPWANEMRLVSVLCFQELLSFLAHLLQSCRAAEARPIMSSLPPVSPRKRSAGARVENAEASEELSILDLPELTLECILEKLTPAGLCNMAAVCSSLRERCCSDHLWEKHMRERWGRVIGQAARRDWKRQLTSSKDSAADIASKNKKKSWIDLLFRLWPASLLKFSIDSGKKISSPLLDDSIICWYRSLESGKVWFPAQVYNREHGHVGFMLSCYDAEVCYDCGTDTFHARYPPHGRRTIVLEEGVQWDRLRAPPVETPAHALHISDCLSDLRPGDHFEIQWRRNKEFPYGWWYGVIGHLESCDGNRHSCRCHLSGIMEVMPKINMLVLASPGLGITAQTKNLPSINSALLFFFLPHTKISLSWNSDSTLLVQGGDACQLIESITAKKAMRLMDFTEELESCIAQMKSQSGRSFGQQMFWSRISLVHF